MGRQGRFELKAKKVTTRVYQDVNQRALAAGGEADGSRQVAKSRPCPDGDHGCRIRGEDTGGPPAKIAVPGKFAKNGGEQSGRDGPKKQTNK